MPRSTSDKDVLRPQEVFISYAREDENFVRRLRETLKQRDRAAWVDWEDIRPTEEFMQAIFAAIEGADTFVSVLTPDSLASVTCGREIAHATAHNKRMVPIVVRDVNASAVPEVLAKLNWIPCRESDDFEAGIEKLFLALDTDLNWIRSHTRLLTRAIEWKNNNKSKSFALRGEDLESAEQWLEQAGCNKERQPTPLQTEYIIASRKATAQRQRITLGLVSLGLAIATVLAIAAVFARQEALKQRATAVARRDRADHVIRFVQNDLPEKLRPIGRLDLMQGVVTEVNKYYDDMQKAEGESVDTLGGKVWVLANQGGIDETKGHEKAAVDNYRAAVPLAEKAQRLAPNSDKALERLANTYLLVGLADQTGGIDQIRKGRETFEKLVARNPLNARWQSQLANSYAAEGIYFFGKQQFDVALSEYRKAFAIREKLAAQSPNDAQLLHELAQSHENIGNVLQQQSQFESALAEHRASQEIFRKLTANEPLNADWQRSLAWSYRRIGEVLRAEGRSLFALSQFRIYAEAIEKLAGQDPANLVWQKEASDAHYLMGSIYFEQQRLEDALAEFRAFHSAIAKFAAGSPTNTALQSMVVVGCRQLASLDILLKDKGDPAEAAQLAAEGLGILAKIEKQRPLFPQEDKLRKDLEKITHDLR